MPNCTLMVLIATPSSSVLTSVENGVHLMHIGLIIDHEPSDFDPCVGHKGHLPCSDHEFGWQAVVPQQTCRHGRSLEAKHFFPVPDASYINGFADFFGGIRRGRQSLPDREGAYLVVQSLEVPARQTDVATNKFQIRPQREKRHGRNLHFTHSSATGHTETPFDRSAL